MLYRGLTRTEGYTLALKATHSLRGLHTRSEGCTHAPKAAHTLRRLHTRSLQQFASSSITGSALAAHLSYVKLQRETMGIPPAPSLSY